MYFFLLFPFLLWIVLPGLALLYYYKIRKQPESKATQTETIDTDPRDQQWLSYLNKQLKSAKTSAEQQLLQKIIDNNPFVKTQQPKTIPEPVVTTAKVSAPAVSKPAKPPVDNAVLLLYFGAFLFVASSGLFIAFSGFDGTIRTLSLAAVMAVMYLGGLTLYNKKQAIKQAGVTFAAIGMAIAPLLGLAAYNLMFNATHGPTIWLGTSVLCIVMYLYALTKIHNTFIGYLFIFSFVSLFQSGVAIFSLPIYYFLWVLLATAIALRFFAYIKKVLPELQQPSAVSARILAPVSLFTSVILIGSQGKWQLAMSLLLAGLYYLSEALIDAKNRINYIDLGHTLLIAASATVGYALRNDWQDAGLALLIITVLHIVTIAFSNAKSFFIKNFTDLALVTAVAASFFSYNNKALLISNMLLAIVLGITAALKFQQTDGYLYAGAFLIALPVVAGQYVAYPSISWFAQSLASGIVLVLLLLIRKLTQQVNKNLIWDNASNLLIYGATFSVLAFAFFASFWEFVLMTLATTFVFIFITATEKQRSWASLSGFVMALPVLQAVGQSNKHLFVLGTLIGLVANIIIALAYHLEPNRWLGSILWFIVPIALYSGDFGITNVQLAWLYVLTTVGFIIARAIARGELYAYKNAPVSSYSKDTSAAYVVGYWLAGITALSIITGGDTSANQHIHTAGIAAALALLVTVLSVFIEKNKNILFAVPLLAQLIVLSALDNVAFDNYRQYNVTVLFSFLVAIGLYAIGSIYKLDALRRTALLTSFIPATTYFESEITKIAMPITLILAGGLTVYEVKSRSQGQKEAAGLIVVAGLMWLMNYYGVETFQAYSHLLAATFALYAYVRYKIKDLKTSDQYLYAMLATATVPLVIQAIGGLSGDAYGWWLLIEQVCFMLLGILIKKRFVTNWGLYVAIGAVLYQLRNLQWAALSVLAVFIIGFAIYHLNKQQK